MFNFLPNFIVSVHLGHYLLVGYLMVPVGEGIGETKGERAGELCWPATSTRLGRVGLCIGGGGPRSSRRDVNATLMPVDGNRMIHLQGGRER